MAFFGQASKVQRGTKNLMYYIVRRAMMGRQGQKERRAIVIAAASAKYRKMHDVGSNHGGNK